MSDLLQIKDYLKKIENCVDNLEKKTLLTQSAALLIGINYQGTSSALKGCINDVRCMKKMLTQRFGMSSSRILCLTDDLTGGESKPTRRNILAGFDWLVEQSRVQGCSSLWFHYSGHGTSRTDQSKDEADGKDECIVPSDFKFISDDEIHGRLVSLLSPGTSLVGFMDCCHSGTLLDLRYRYIAGTRHRIENPKSKGEARVLVVSGCRDSQTSSDACYGGEWSGAMTKFLIATLEEADFEITCYNLLRKLRNKLQQWGHTQVPQLTCSQRLSGSSMFSSRENSAAYLAASGDREPEN